MSNPALTTAPVPVDTTGGQAGLLGTGVCSQGPYKNADGDVFCILVDQNGVDSNIVAFQKQAASAVFVPRDTILNPSGGALLYCQFLKTGGTGGKGLIRCAYTLVTTAPPIPMLWADYDCGTNSFTLTSLPTLMDLDGDGGQPGMPFVVRSSGDTLVLYQTASTNVGFRVCSAGTWSAFVSAYAVAGHTYAIAGLYLDPSGTSVAIIEDRVGGVSTWEAFTIDAGNAVGPLNTIAAATAGDVPNLGMIGSDGNIYIPLSRGNKASLFSAPSPSGSVWAITDFQTSVFNNITVAAIMEDPPGTLLYFWQFEDVSGTPNVLYVSLNVSGGGWGVKSVYYDVNALPPNLTPPSDQFVSQFNLGVGSTLSLMSMLTAAAGAFAAFFAGASSGPIPPIAAFAPQIAQTLILSFPMDDPCCCPKLVGCVECAKDGNMYAISKTPLVKGNE